MGFPEDSEQKWLRGYQECHIATELGKHGTGRRGSLSLRKLGGNIRVMPASPPHVLYPKPLLCFQVLFTHRCRLRVQLFSDTPDSCGLTESFCWCLPGSYHFSYQLWLQGYVSADLIFLLSGIHMSLTAGREWKEATRWKREKGLPLGIPFPIVSNLAQQWCSPCWRQ